MPPGPVSGTILLAGGHANDVLDLGERPLGKTLAAERLLKPALLLVAEHIETDSHPRDALELADLLDHRLLEVGADRTARRRQRDHDLDPAVVPDLQGADHAQLHD